MPITSSFYVSCLDRTTDSTSLTPHVLVHSDSASKDGPSDVCTLVTAMLGASLNRHPNWQDDEKPTTARQPTVTYDHFPLAQKTYTVIFSP